MKLEFDGSTASLTLDGKVIADTFAVYFSPVKRAPIAEYLDENGLKVYANLNTAGILKPSEKLSVARPKVSETVKALPPVEVEPAIKPIK